MSTTPFSTLAELGEQLESTTSRLELTRLLAEFLRALEPDEIAPGVRLITGQVFPEWDGRALNVSWQTVSDLVDEQVQATREGRESAMASAPDGGEAIRRLLDRYHRRPPDPPPLTLLDVYHAFERIAETAGARSRQRKADLLRGLLSRATPVEVKYIVKNVAGEMRHGAGEGIVLDAIAAAAGIEQNVVRRANQFWGDLGEVARAALVDGADVLRAATVKLFRPLKPMLAQTAEDLAEAFERFEGQVALEYKLDGARVQIHRQGDEVRIYSRYLQDVTVSLKDVAASVRAGLAVQAAIVEGEAIAIDGTGRPRPFQDLMRRFRRIHAIEATVREVPVHLYLFDVLYAEGQSLIDQPYTERWRRLEIIAGQLDTVPRLLPQRIDEASAFSDAAFEAGHEGVMAKDLNSPYSPGVRGKSWLKLKHVVTVDLVIVGADWGYGRRTGWLSNYHLGARDTGTGEFLVVGKTFKGLTDAEFEMMTARLLNLERSRQGSTVFVVPQAVVEVAFNEIQASPRYPGGLALRFARIIRIRDDKPPQDADSIQFLRELYEKQFAYKGRDA